MLSLNLKLIQTEWFAKNKVPLAGLAGHYWAYSLGTNHIQSESHLSTKHVGEAPDMKP